MRRIVVITGVGKGFGRALFSHFLKDYYVVGVTRSKEDIEQIKKDTSFDKDFYELIEADVTNYDSLNARLSKILTSNADLVYALINNAGVRFRKAFLDLTIDDLQNTIESNLFSAVNLSKLLIPYFVDNGGGRIVNISSLLSTNALPELSAYAISKAGLDGLSRSIAVEFAKLNITCNSILPGFCKTSYYENFKSKHDLYLMTLNRTPAGRWGGDDEITGVCDLLLSSKGSYINGASIAVDGGWAAS